MNLRSSILVTAFLAVVDASCPSETTIDLTSAATELKLMGFSAKSVERFTGETNKIVLKGYDVEPIIEVTDEAVMVTAGSACEETVVDESAAAAAALGITSLFSKNALGLGLASLLFAAPMVSADCTSEISIEIYTTESTLDDILAEEFHLGECPTEAFYFEHHESVYGGYEGCVAEKYLTPCGVDSRDKNTSLTFSEGSCVDTGSSFTEQTFWILWGDPMDKEELVERTGEVPTVVFPMQRGPYPHYKHGISGDETGALTDDAKTAKAVAKDFLEYIGALDPADRDNWLVSMTEGAENGIQMLWAGKALEIARTTCNRDIYVLMEAPAYGYSNGEIAQWVNTKSSSFYEGEECLCFAEGTCKDKTVTLNNVGYFPPNIPSRVGGDGITYAADSDSPASPWFESLVFPENPSGRIKIPQIPNSNRRVCDGVYVWPMYFYFNDFEIPAEDIPDCAGWSYAVTKGYSASVRAGFITYKKDAPEAATAALGDIASMFNSLGYGSYSEWSWSGQMQLQKHFMAKPISDPTSWIGAYSAIMKEKWDAINSALEGCPVVTLTNYGQGAYSFMIMNEDYLGLADSSYLSSFMGDVLGVIATTYYWGFRGADPAEYYGEGVGTYDFIRMQMYRDLNVYLEVGRRMSIICADQDADVGFGTVSPNDYKAIQTAARRRRLHEVEDRADRRRMLEEEVPHLTRRQLNRVLDNMEMRKEIDAKADACAPEFNMNCLFDTIGRRFDDY